jgi:signal transduction histidine kinase
MHEAPDLQASIRTLDGKWINIQLSNGAHRPPFEQWPLLYALGTTLAALLLAAVFMGRRVAQPLQVLAQAARGLRRGEAGPPVPETGPAPVREAAQAFNAMSERVSTTLKSQQAMMAAVAHDLRTPISVLRVRAEFVVDEETRSRLLETINEMQQMTEAVLSAMRIDGANEPAQSVDMGALAESLCADMEELDRDVRFTGAPQVTCMCRASEIRRALGNLIDNAVRYGDRAEVSIEVRAGFLAIHVDDEGPGIPQDQMTRVFEPFARLEESRSADTGGHGLGLSIARLIARGHGGDITLSNRNPRGLRATLSLPMG